MALGVPLLRFADGASPAESRVDEVVAEPHAGTRIVVAAAGAGSARHPGLTHQALDTRARDIDAAAEAQLAVP